MCEVQGGEVQGVSRQGRVLPGSNHVQTKRLSMLLTFKHVHVVFQCRHANSLVRHAACHALPVDLTAFTAATPHTSQPSPHHATAVCNHTATVSTVLHCPHRPCHTQDDWSSVLPLLPSLQRLCMSLRHGCGSHLFPALQQALTTHHALSEVSLHLHAPP